MLFNPAKAQQVKSEQLHALSDEKSALQKYTGGGSGENMTTSDTGKSRLELEMPNHLVLLDVVINDHTNLLLGTSVKKLEST